MGSKSLFVTATGTDVGKTYISALLVKKMRDNGFNCGYYKPVLSGAIRIDDKTLLPSDCDFVIKKSGLEKDPISCLTYCFEEAVSPHLASVRQGEVIEFDKIKKDYINMTNSYDYTVVEGAGGITCPLVIDEGRKLLLSDVIKSFKINTLIVADAGLGTINSVILTCEYAKRNGINIVGIVLNNYDDKNFMHIDNKQVIENLTGIPIVATVKLGGDMDINKNELEALFGKV